jgi:hypothetical protein
MNIKFPNYNRVPYKPNLFKTHCQHENCTLKSLHSTHLLKNRGWMKSINMA